MTKRPHPVRHHLSTSPTARDLLDQVRNQQDLLARVRSMLQPPLDRHCHAAVLSSGRLLLYTDSPAWSSRLRFFSRQLDARLRQENLAVDSIAIRVMIRPRPKLRESRASRRLSAANADLLRTLADEIGDPPLSNALRRLGRHGR